MKLRFIPLILSLAACAPGKSISSEPAPLTPPVGDTLCIAGSAGQSAMTNPPLLAAEIARFQDLGVKYVRYDLTWSSIETTPGVYNLDWIDAPLKTLADAGLQSIPILDYGNDLYNGNLGTDYPTPPAPFAAFAGAVAARFGTRFGPYEIWNEENAGYRFWMPKEDPVAYAQLASAAAAAIKSACPQCQSIFGGVDWQPETITGGVPFIQQAYAAVPDLEYALDGVAVHPYSYYPPQDPPDDSTAPEVPLVDMLTEAAAATGLASPPPMWITEVGWPVFASGPDQPTQAADLIKAYALAAKVAPRSVCWYTLQDGPNYLAFPPEDAFGLLEYDANGPANATPKPAYGAYKAVSQWLGPTGYSSDRGAELGLTKPGDAALFFRDTKGTRGVTVFWSESAVRNSTVRLALHGSVSATLVDFAGNASTLTPDKNNGVTVTLDATPRMLVEQQQSR